MNQTGWPAGGKLFTFSQVSDSSKTVSQCPGFAQTHQVLIYVASFTLCWCWFLCQAFELLQSNNWIINFQADSWKVPNFKINHNLLLFSIFMDYWEQQLLRLCTWKLELHLKPKKVELNTVCHCAACAGTLGSKWLSLDSCTFSAELSCFRPVWPDLPSTMQNTVQCKQKSSILSEKLQVEAAEHKFLT